MGLKTKIIKVDPKFKDELDDIKIMKIKKTNTLLTPSDRRLTMAIRRHSLWSKIKEDIIYSELDDKKNE